MLKFLSKRLNRTPLRKSKILNHTLQSKLTGFSWLKGNWNLSVNYKGIFHLNIFNNKRSRDLGSNQSKENHSCFDVTVNGGTKSTQGLKNISTNNVSREHSVNISKAVAIEAKVTIKTSQTNNTNILRFEYILKSLSDNVGDLKSDSINPDFIINVKTVEFKVHKSVLSAHSPVFKTMFRSEMKEAADNKIVINDVSPFVFEKLLIFIYCGNLPEINNEIVMNLFVAANKYGVEKLRNECEKRILYDLSEHAISVYKFANLFLCQELKKL